MRRQLNPSKTAVPLWGQTTQIPSSLSSKRDCSPDRVNSEGMHDATIGLATGHRRGRYVLDGSTQKKHMEIRTYVRTDVEEYWNCYDTYI